MKSRVTAGVRATLAEEIFAVGGQHDALIMPLRFCGTVELDQRYPPIKAAEDEEEDGLLGYDLLRTGEELAGDMVMNTKTFGERRVREDEERVGYVRPPGQQARLVQVTASGTTLQ